MPIYEDVILRLDERAAQATANQASNAVGNTLSSGMATHGRTAATTFMGGLTSGISSEVSRVSGALSGITGAAGSMGTGVAAAGAVAAAGVAAIAVAAFKVGQELYSIGARFDAVVDGIAVRTGKLGAELDALSQSVSNVATNTASSFEEIADIGSQLDVALDLSGRPLEDLTKQIADLNRMTGEKVNIREFGQALRGFGGGGSDATQALDDIYAAATNTLIPVGELIGTLQNVGPAARTLGLDMNETAGLITLFEQAGLDSNRMLGGLSSAAAKFADAGLNMDTALADTITQIQGFIAAGRDAEAIDLANKVFGTRSAQLFIDAIRQGTLNVGTLNDGLGTTEDAISRMDQATSDWSETWEKLKNRALDALEPIGTKVFEILNGIGQILLMDGGAGIASYTNPDAAPPVPVSPTDIATGTIPGLPPGSTGPRSIGDLLLPSTTGPGVPAGNIPAAPVPTGPPQDIAGALADNKAGGPKGPTLPVVPFSGDPMSLLQGFPVTSSLYSAAEGVLGAQHSRAQAESDLNTLLASNEATAEQIQKARNKLAETDQDIFQAELRLNEAKTSATEKYAKTLEGASAQLGEIGASLDKDFGISKGLAGIAENITKFVANLAAAPLLGQLDAISQANPSKGGYGLMGVLGAQGAFGSQFTGIDYSAQASAMGTAGLQPGMAGASPNVNAMLALAQASSGKTAYAPASDLVNGLADCSGSVSDLYEVLKTGTTTPGREFTTTNFASDAEAAKLGFLPGFQQGALNVGVNPYPGMSGHMAATLPNGVNFEGGGGTGGGALYGGSASGALDPQFEKQYYLPVSGSGGPAAAGPSPGDLYSPANTSPGLNNPLAPLPPPGTPGFGGGTGMPFGLQQPGGPGANTTQIGGGPGLTGVGKGGVGMSDGLMGAAMAAAGGLDMMMPGAGQAAATVTKLANRAIQFGGQAVGIGVQGAIDTLIPFGGSKLASNNWFTKIIGGLAGAAPAMPNMAGKSSQPTPQQVANVDPNTKQHGQGGGQPPGQTTYNANITNNHPRDEGGSGRDALHVWQNQGPGM